MIKFFRRIREKLVAENKFSKYLLYAIGEILLVMVGILLALQVNNWNEMSKERKQEIALLKRLRSDLTLNLKEVTNLYKITTLRAQAKDSILFYLHDPEKYNSPLRVYLHEIQYLGGIFNYANTSYKSLENGGINVISNDSLRSRITVMYEEDFKNIEVRRHGEADLIQQRLKPIVLSEFIPSDIASKRFQNMNIQVLNFPKNPSELAKSQDFINVLTDLQEFALLRKNLQARTIEKLQELISAVDQEVVELTR